MGRLPGDEPRASLAVALGLAAGIHVAAAFLGYIVGRESAGASPAEGGENAGLPFDVELVEMAVDRVLEEATAPPATPPEPEPEASPGAGARVALRVARPPAQPSPNAPPGRASDEGVGQGETGYSLDPTATPSPSGTERTSEGATRVDLGIGAGDWSRWVDPLAKAEDPPSRGERRSPAPVSSTGGLAEALEARDQQVGLGPAGPVLSAAHDAGYSDQAPALGTATFSITVLRSGSVEVRLTGASSRAEDWQKVGASIAAALRRKPPRISASRNGVRLGIELVAEERWPNGQTSRGEGPAIVLSPGKFQTTDETKKELEANNPLAVPPPGSPVEQPKFNLRVDTPGVYLQGRGKVCSYKIGIPPFGAGISGGCDPSNIGAKPRRVVSTRVTSQTML